MKNIIIETEIDSIIRLMMTFEIELIIRLIGAAICGGILGIEREHRQKSAGIRTHVIVAIASAIMMIVSKYGFFDVIDHDSVSLDPSRVVSGVVSAIGFLGAGIIFVRKSSAVGLTTAAGIWATVAIGIAMGALGSDAAIEASDVVLMDDDPQKIPKAIKIAKKCMRIVYENIVFAIAVKFICLILGAFGIANMWLAIFADVGVMVIAVINSIRALMVKDL